MFGSVKLVTIYTDGSCLGNPGPGGWGAILIYKNQEKAISGSKRDTTNNQMELTAVIEALRSLKTKCKIELYTDSKYVQNGMTKWIDTWIKNHWKTASRKPVKNQELWQDLHDEVKRHDVSWHWVKAHNGNLYNERVDVLANKAATLA